MVEATLWALIRGEPADPPGGRDDVGRGVSRSMTLSVRGSNSPLSASRSGHNFAFREVCFRLDQDEVLVCEDNLFRVGQRVRHARDCQRPISSLTRRCRRTGASVAALPLAPAAERLYR